MLRISVYGQIVVGLTAIQMYLGPLNSMRPALLLMLLGIVGIASRPNRVAWENLRRSWGPKAVMWLFFIACGSAAFGLSFGGSINFILNFYIRILIFFVLLVLALRTVQDLRFILWSYVISVGILVVLSLTVMDLEPTMGGLGRLEGTGMFDANDLGMIFLMGLPLAFFFNYNSVGAGRWISRAVIVGIPAGIALTGSRGAMVGLAIVGPVLFLVLSRVGLMKRLMAIGVIVGGLLVAAPEGYWEQMRTIFTAEEDYNVTEDYGRVELAKRGVGYMLKYPFFGVGIGNFPRAEGTISPIAVERLSAGESVQWIAPHNTYAQVGAELGLFAFGIWLSLLYAGTIGLWRLRRRLPESWNRQSPERKFLRELCLFLPLSFLAFAVTSFFLSHAFTPPFYILIGSMAAVRVLVERELALDRPIERRARPISGRVRRPASRIR